MMRNTKITSQHLARRAMVYLRQSSERQVQHNRESRELQYALADYAKKLGFRRVEVIDDDLGQSAAMGAVRREGFERLLAAITLGDVGIVFSREASRLSRTDKDWCRLLEVCQLFDTLIGDADHVYDCSSLDDQLLLGIKGTLSVIELKVLRQRLLEGMRHKAKKGQLYRTLAAGYVLDPLGRCIKDPNQRVQEGIALVFEKFRQLGSARQTLLWFHAHGVELPVNKPRQGRLCVVFQFPTLSRIGEILHNPIYAGAYVYGRRPNEIVLVDGAPRKRQRSALRPEQAYVFLPNHHEGYIDWTTYEENQAMMRTNNVATSSDESIGAARQGQGLLAGLLRCRRCGRKLHVRYWGRRGTSARYLCQGDYETGGRYCLRFGGRGVDRRVSEEVLQALSPLGIEASLQALRRLGHTDQAQRIAWERQLQQAEYEAKRAFEQYNEVDPRYRLVAEELERRWNEKLQHRDAIQASLRALEVAHSPLSDHETEALKTLGRNFGAAWHSPSCPPELKKRILRTVLEEIVVDEIPVGTLSVILHWKGGTHTAFEMPKPTPVTQHKTDVQDVDLIRRLAVRYSDAVIASVLNRLGRKTGKGRRWAQGNVASARRKYDIADPKQTPFDADLLSLQAAARYAGVSNTTIQRLIAANLLPCNQIVAYAPREIWRSDLDSEPLRSILGRLRNTGKLILPGDVSTAQRSLFEEISTL